MAIWQIDIAADSLEAIIDGSKVFEGRAPDGSNPKKDLQLFKKLFYDERFKPDQIKEIIDKITQDSIRIEKDYKFYRWPFVILALIIFLIELAYNIMSLTAKELEKLAQLARLDLAETERVKLAGDISSILQYVGKLQELKTEDGFEVETAEQNLREDKVVGLATDEQLELIKLAPEQENNLVKTKAVFEE